VNKDSAIAYYDFRICESLLSAGTKTFAAGAVVAGASQRSQLVLEFALE
jgi:hypothetical protein